MSAIPWPVGDRITEWERMGGADWTCPGLSPHPARLMGDAIQLQWVDQPLGDGRVREYTCACIAVFYELVSVGGIFQIHRTIQRKPWRHAWAGSWRREEAYQAWMLVLTGRAR